MKKINLMKLALDIVLAIVFALLFNKRVVAGLAFHETAGLAIGLGFVIHKALNWKWIKQVTANLFTKKLSFKTRFGYILDVLLLLLVGYIMISGVLISKYLAPDLGAGNSFLLKTTHISFSYLALLLVGIHVGLHWSWVVNTVKRVFGITQERKVLVYISKVAVVLVLVFGVYDLYSSGYSSRVAMVGNAFSAQQTPGFTKGSGGEHLNRGELPNIEERGALREGPPRGDQGFVIADVLGVLSLNLGIIAVFAIVTYYVERFLTSRKGAS